MVIIFKNTAHCATFLAVPPCPLDEVVEFPVVLNASNVFVFHSLIRVKRNEGVVGVCHRSFWLRPKECRLISLRSTIFFKRNKFIRFEHVKGSAVLPADPLTGMSCSVLGHQYVNHPGGHVGVGWQQPEHVRSQLDVNAEAGGG